LERELILEEQSAQESGADEPSLSNDGRTTVTQLTGNTVD